MRCNLKEVELAKEIVDTLEGKKAEDILLLDIHEISDFADYFVIANGTSDRMLESLSRATLESLKKEHGIITHAEGQARDGWILIDAGNVIVHLFSPDQRDYYSIEMLWSQGKTLLHVQ